MIDLSSLLVANFWIFLQVLTRFSALVAIAPVFGARQVPAQIKIWITLVLSAALTPLVQPTFAAHGAAIVPTNLYDFAAVLVMQAIVGLMMGFVVSMVLSAFQMAGALLDLQVGFSMAQTFNPTLAEMAAPLAQFQYFYALLLFLLANGHHILLVALTKSFAMVPASMVDISSGAHLSMISDITFGALVNGLKIAAPTCAVLLIVDISFALLNRAMPQMNIFYTGMPLKVIAGLSVLGVLLPATAIFAGQLVSGEPQMLSDMLHAMRHA